MWNTISHSEGRKDILDIGEQNAEEDICI